MLVVRVTPRAYKAGEHQSLPERLGAGTFANCPGKWRVLSSAEGERIGMVRVFRFEIEPLDSVARSTSENQML